MKQKQKNSVPVFYYNGISNFIFVSLNSVIKNLPDSINELGIEE
jgi:hypothetical protein